MCHLTVLHFAVATSTVCGQDEAYRALKLDVEPDESPLGRLTVPWNLRVEAIPEIVQPTLERGGPSSIRPIVRVHQSLKLLEQQRTIEEQLSFNDRLSGSLTLHTRTCCRGLSYRCSVISIARDSQRSVH